MVFVNFFSRVKIQALESELQEFHSGECEIQHNTIFSYIVYDVMMMSPGRKVVSDDGSVVMNDLASEVTMLRAENDK